MNKKLLTLIGGSVLSAFLLVGCNNDAEPPPEGNEPGAKTNAVDNDFNNNNGLDRNGARTRNFQNGNNNGMLDDNGGRRGGIFNDNDNDNGVLDNNDDGRGIFNNNLDDNNRNGRTLDRNRANDGDVIRDNNGRGEDMIEDAKDVRDRDRKDD